VKFHPTAIAGVIVVETTPFKDHRGAFSRWFCSSELSEVIGDRSIKQINHSCTSKVGAVRGLHFQYPPYAEMKMVRCIKGRVWDVAVDLRKGSPTFLQWHAEELSSENSRMLLIPEGCAHGFQVLEGDSELLYMHTAAYEKSAEGAISYNDPLLDINWPMPVTDLSQRDSQQSPINYDFTGIEI